MSSYRKPFKSIAEIKSAGEFICKGKIIPQRILKTKRRNKSLILSGANQWAIPTPNGYILFVENNDGEFESAVVIRAAFDGFMQGSPYSEGVTSWVGNYMQGEKEFLRNFNDKYLTKCTVGNSIHDNSMQLKINLDF